MTARFAMSLSRAGIVRAEVIGFFVEGEGGTYEQQIFTIQISVEAIVSHTVDRSVVDFVELDRRLRRRFPKTAFSQSTLPMDESVWNMLKKTLEKGAQQQQHSPLSPSPATRSSFSSVSGSVTSGGEFMSPTRNIFVNPTDRMGPNKIKAFNLFLQGLMHRHEVCVSEELLYFLDQEVSSFSGTSEIPEPLSVHDLLLLGSPAVSCVVRKGSQEVVRHQAAPGQMVVWSFSTHKYDIAFSIEVNGQTKLSYTRYDSHRKPSCGSLLMEEAGQVVLRFDNSYAKWHSKNLSYRTRVVPVEEYYLSKEKALEAARECKAFELRRSTLRRAIIRHAASLSGVVHTASVIPDAAEQDELRVQSLELQCLRLQAELVACHEDLDQAADELDELEERNHSLADAHKSLSESWAYTLKELEQSREREKRLREELAKEREKHRVTQAQAQAPEEGPRMNIGFLSPG